MRCQPLFQVMCTQLILLAIQTGKYSLFDETYFA